MSDSNSVSVCNIFKDSTSKIIEKLEMKIPSHFQIYSDMYKEYLHVIDDAFGTCVLSEKEFLDKMNLDKNSIKNVESYMNYLTKIWIYQIENYDNYLRWYSQMRVSGMRAYDQFSHKMLEMYSTTIANLNKNFEK